jgi:hypothetical protein
MTSYRAWEAVVTEHDPKNTKLPYMLLTISLALAQGVAMGVWQGVATGQGLPKVLPGPVMPYPSTPCNP